MKDLNSAAQVSTFLNTGNILRAVLFRLTTSSEVFVNSDNFLSEKPIDLKGKYIFPGLVDMRVFVGEPGYEYKENFRTLSNAALSGGVTSVVTMPNTCLLYTSPSPRDRQKSRMPSSA